MSFNNKYFCDIVLAKFLKIFLLAMGISRQKRFFLHIVNAKLHNSQTTTEFLLIEKFTEVPHQPYSQNIVPNNFYLFGAIKQCLYGCQGRSFEELQENVQRIL
jgi:hypothetical protein